MDDLKRLRRGILIDPADDHLRLVYADALEEAGDSERAELIRAQIRLAEMGPLSAYFFSGDPERAEFDRLRRRERALLAVRTATWMDWCRPLTTLSPFAAWDFRRGFVESVSLPLPEFMDYAEALFLAHPITSVTLTDREPVVWLDGGWTFISEAATWVRHSGNRHAFAPAALARRLDGPHDTPELAQADLSRAAVAYGRSLAGLPPLK